MLSLPDECYPHDVQLSQKNNNNIVSTTNKNVDSEVSDLNKTNTPVSDTVTQPID